MPMHATRIILAGLSCLVLLPFAATAQPVTATQIGGTATIGPATRQVMMHFSCAASRGKINNLSFGLDIPQAEELQRVFDVGPFEGPTSIGGHVHLVATGSASTAQITFGAYGSFGTNGAPDTSFTFQGSLIPDPGSRAILQKLQDVAAALSNAPAKIVWRIENPRNGGQPIEATADISETDAAHLRAAVAPCKKS